MSVRWLVLGVCFVCAVTGAQDVHVRVSPLVTTGIEGKDEFPTIQNALDHHALPGPGGRVWIEIAPGTYHERVIVTQNHPNVTLVGIGKHPEDTVITNSLNARQAGGTFFTETMEINGDGFEAANLTVENTAGDTGQAVAAAVRSDRAVFRRVRFLGHQDTLFADYGRQYYLDCFIAGGVDFIFGNATAVFDRSVLHANGPGYLTAQSRTSPEQTTGFVILHSHVTSSFGPATALTSTTETERRRFFLGRPWRPYARVVFLRTSLPENLNRAGWDPWGKASNQSTAYFAEQGSTGPGAGLEGRAAWAHALTADDVKRYLPGAFLKGLDGWDAAAEAAKLP